MILKQSDTTTAPLDFEDIPKSVEDIPLERHGCLVLLVARYATAVLFDSTQTEMKLAVYPDISKVFANFLRNNSKTPDEVATEAPVPLLDSLLALALLSYHCGPDAISQDDSDFDQLILAMAACTQAPNVRQLSRTEKVTSKIFHGNPNVQSRYNLIRQVLEKEEFQYARESALGWLKQELLSATATPSSASDPSNPFLDPESFNPLFHAIYKRLPDYYSNLSSLPAPILATLVVKFTSRHARMHITALNLYYLMCKSKTLHGTLELGKLDAEFMGGFLVPLKDFANSISEDAQVSETVVKELDEGMAQAAKSAADVVLHVIRDIESVKEADS